MEGLILQNTSRSTNTAAADSSELSLESHSSCRPSMKHSSLVGYAGLATTVYASRSSHSQFPVKEKDIAKAPPNSYSVPVAASHRPTSNRILLIFSQQTLHNMEHLINITIGTPPQAFTVSLDFNSNTFFVPSTRLSSDEWGQRKYNSTESTTYLPNGIVARANYWNYIYEGFLSGDTVSIGGLKIEAQIFEEYTTARRRAIIAFRAGFDGVVGFAPPWNSKQDAQKYPNYLALLQAQGNLEENAFSLKLPRSAAEQGEITFGGSNPDLYTGTFRNVTLVPDHLLDQWQGQWVVPITSLTLNTTLPIHYPTPNYTAVFTYRPILALPTAFVTSFSAAIGVPLGVDHLWAPIACERRPFLPELTFELDGESFTIDGWDYVFFAPISLDGKTECGIWVKQAEYYGIGDETLMIGTVFLKRWYSRWDWGERKIGCEYYCTL
jgi:hypothetical protein